MKTTKKVAKAVKAKKRIKRKVRMFWLGLAFFAGAACMGLFVYANRNAVAALVNGKPIPKGAFGKKLFRVK